MNFFIFFCFICICQNFNSYTLTGYTLKEELILEIIKKNIIINRPVKCGNTQIGVDGDVIVPDIKPDILKILQADGKAVVTETELSEGRLIVSGRVNVNILYVPDRDDEKIKCIETSFDFSTRIDKSDIMPDMQACVEAEVEKIDFQVLNCRKLRIKTTVGIAYKISEQASIDLATGLDDENSEVCITPIEIMSLVDLKHSDFSVRESFELPPGHTAIEEILKTDITICDTDYKIVTGRAVVKGIINLNCLYLDTDCCIKSCDFEAPFTEIFDVSDADEDTVCDISFCVKDIVCAPEADSDGDIKILALDAIIGIKIEATKKVNTDLLIDCFCPGNETLITKNSKDLEKIISSGFYQTTLREIVAPDVSCPNLKGIYNVFATPSIEKSEVLDNSVSVSGNISCFVLYIADSEETPVYSMKKTIPFSCMIDTPKSKSGMDCFVDAKILHTSYNLNPSGEAEIRCILSVCAKVSVNNTLELIDDLEVLPLSKEQRKGIVLYFVQKNDTLWDIAKRYYVSQNDILSVNNLEDTTPLCEGMTLLIPTV